MKTFNAAIIIAATVLGTPVLAREAAVTPAAVVAKGRPTIASGDRALAMWEIQNLMSKHEYYHAAGQNLAEVDALWVARKGKFAATATFGSPAWVMYGLETIRGAYGEENERNRKKALENIAKVDPKIAVTEANMGAGHEWVMHTSTTPVIEIAGDGKTAKGIWYSPGVGIMAKFKDDKVGAGGSFFYEKYAGDFVFEDGQWKIWHLQMSYDYVPGLPASMIDPIIKALDNMGFSEDHGEVREAGERDGFKLPPGFRKPLYSYPAYSPMRPGIIYPKFPEPYYSFGETFTYCNCEQTAPTW